MYERLQPTTIRGVILVGGRLSRFTTGGLAAQESRYVQQTAPSNECRMVENQISSTTRKGKKGGCRAAFAAIAVVVVIG